MKKKFTPLYARLIFTCSVLLFITSVQAQNKKYAKPNYKKIQTNINNKSSEYYYPTLLLKFQQGDTTLSMDQKRHLYYGYVFNPNYSPYGSNPFYDSLVPFLKKEDHSVIDLYTMLEFSDSILSKNPFNLDVINYQLFAYEKLNQKRKFDVSLNKLRTVVDALISSGNGKKLKTAFYVIYIRHEYNLLDVLGYNFGGSQSLIKTCDYLTIEENNEGLKGLYFDVSPCLNNLKNQFD